MEGKITFRLPEEQIIFLKVMKTKYNKNISKLIRIEIQNWMNEEGWIYNPKTKKWMFL